MPTRPLAPEDRLALEVLLAREPTHNLFHLSALVEHGMAPASEQGKGPWAVGAFRGEELVGALMALRGTGGIYHTPGDGDTLQALAKVVLDKAHEGRLQLLSGHASQLEPLLPLVREAGIGRFDRCYFNTLLSSDLRLPDKVQGFGAPRLGTESDMERLIDFYAVGFYSLAHLPSRAAWHNVLSEQLAYRILFLFEDVDGRVIPAALSSA